MPAAAGSKDRIAAAVLASATVVASLDSTAALAFFLGAAVFLPPTGRTSKTITTITKSPINI